MSETVNNKMCIGCDFVVTDTCQQINFDRRNKEDAPHSIMIMFTVYPKSLASWLVNLSTL